MNEAAKVGDRKSREQTAMELTSYILHKHYCENDVEPIIALMDPAFSWLGTGENEYAVARDTVAEIFRQFKGQVPKCRISDEEYTATEATPDVYICSGRLWITTDPSTNVYLRVHQRVTMVFCWKPEGVRCSHIHISNPYIEMSPDDVGFPSKMAQQSYEYLQACVQEQKQKIAEQADELSSIVNTVPCVIMRFFRTHTPSGPVYRLLTLNREAAKLFGRSEEEIAAMDWSRGFCCGLMEGDNLGMEQALQTLKQPGDLSTVDYCIRSESGELRYFSGNYQLVREDAQGQVIQKISFDITERIKLEQQLERMSFEDSLTGVFNRSKFSQDRADYERSAHLGVACFDLNGLKQINDQNGHLAGDDLIRKAAHAISRYFADKTYRMGGDEFTVVDDMRTEDAFRTAVQSVCADLEREGVHISAGLSWRSSGGNVKEQAHEADLQMYQAKEQYYKEKGRDRRWRDA